MITPDEIARRQQLWSQGYWEVPENLDTSNFNFDWRPDPWDRPYIHQFGTQWQKTGGPRFVVPEHQGVKYQDCQRALSVADNNNRAWRTLKNNVSMDYSWHPDDNDPPYIYVFGNQHYGPETMPTVLYRVKGATEKKYITDVKATLTPDKTKWEIPEFIDDSNFDYSWEPNPSEPPYIHQFGTQHQNTGGPRYITENALAVKFEDFQRVIKVPNMRQWRNLYLIEDNFDYSWHPDDNDPPYIYVFGNQWYDSDRMPTVLFRVKGATEKKYVNTIKATLSQNKDKFESITSRKFEFDYSWVPDPHDPPYIYVFGNQHHSSKDMPTLMYKVDGATTTKYVDDIKATLLEDKTDWVIPDDIDDSMFDYSWYPSIHEPDQIYQFGTQWQKTGGPKLIVGSTDKIKLMDTMRVQKLSTENNRAWRPLYNATFDYSWHPDDNDPPYIYVFGNQWYDSLTMPTILYRVKGATEKKYMDLNAVLLPNKEKYKSLTNLDIEFDYSWAPDPHDPPYVYVFGNQWHDSITMPTLMYCVEGATATKYIDTVKATLKPNKDNWEIPDDVDVSNFDFSWVPDPNEPPYIYEFGTQWQKTGGPRYIVKGAKSTKFVDTQHAIKLPNMRNWRIIEPIVNEHFDFSWHPDSTEENYMYVFGNQYFDAETMPTVMYKSKQSVGSKYITDIKADLDIKVIDYVDSIYDSVIDNKFDTAYALFTNSSNIDCLKLLGGKTDTLHIAGNRAIVPRNCRNQIHDKLTDYYDIVKHSETKIEPIDIIFVSNGEACADENLDHLLGLNLPNRIVHIKGVNGRVASQHAASQASNTHWYFLVNAKLKVNKDFDFNWQPDILKSRRHYIFTATNPLNGLEYGHQAIVANNKILTLNTVVRGLDFTMDSAHEVVNLNSGVSRYNTSEWDTYRTAFRECIKLKYYGDKESMERLNVWLTVANGDFAQYSLQGAKDAVDYYEAVNGDLEKLKLSYDWAWIKDRFNK